MAKILITGATGTVGAAVVSQLERAAPGAPLVKASGKKRAEPGWVEFDFLRPETFGPALEGVDRVFLMRPPALAQTDKQFGPFLDALAARSKAGDPLLKAVVFLSLQGADTMPWVPHGNIEKALAARDLPWTFLRPSFFFQNLTGTHGAEIQATGALTLPAGAGRTAFIDTRDIAEVAANLLLAPETHLHRAYELTGSESLTYTEVMAELSRVSGRNLVYRPVGFFRFYRHCRSRGVDRAMTLVMTLLYGLCRTGQASRLSPQMAELLGRPPRTLAQFAADNAHVWR